MKLQRSIDQRPAKCICLLSKYLSRQVVTDNSRQGQSPNWDQEVAKALTWESWWEYRSDVYTYRQKCETSSIVQSPANDSKSMANCVLEVLKSSWWTFRGFE